VETRRALIISSHALFAEAIARLLQAESVEVIGRVEDLEAARTLLQDRSADAIIVDHDDPLLRDAEIVSQLVDRDEAGQVIFVTLAGNQMIVHHRERVENVTPQALVRAIRFPPKESGRS
jgi:DNA-binding NarL/FixJ family response regulator